MMVVIGIMGTLALIVGPSVFRNVGDANVVSARSQLEVFAVALESFRIDVGRYPTSEEGLQALRTRPAENASSWRGPYLRKTVPPDPWGRTYRYASPGTANADSYDVFTLGRDGDVGGVGEDADVTSWDGPIEP
jgi:general secretion pathway protein G